jgi:hypothetical protein
MIGRTVACKKKIVILRLYKSLVRPHLETRVLHTAMETTLKEGQ